MATPSRAPETRTLVKSAVHSVSVRRPIKEGEAGVPIADLVRKHGISRAT